MVQGLVRIGISGLALALSAAALAQNQPGNPSGAGNKPEQAPRPTTDPRSIWPAGLEQIAGRYVFLQVASPGGFWDRIEPKEGRTEMRQLSINEVPAELREKLTHAELILSDLKTPTRVEAEERTSPSGRGKLRYYDEHADGRLVMKGLPGIGGNTDDPGEYSGPVSFSLSHQSHSNPSVSGIFQLRVQQEPTWGAATIDAAELSAETPPAKPGEEGRLVIGNARILRSGTELFAFTEWSFQDDRAQHHIVGSVRLVRTPSGTPPAIQPGRPAPARLRSTSRS